MKQKETFYNGVIVVLLLSTAYISIQSILVTQKETVQEHLSATPQPKSQLPSLGVFINENWCFDLWPQDKAWFNTQAYRWWQYKDDSVWLMSHFKSAFTQGEWACGSNSLSTALYWQKNMINRFIQEIEGIEKKKWKNPQFDYVKAQAKALQAEAAKRSMNQGERLDCYGSTSPEAMLCRPLTNIDWLEALFPSTVEYVKSRKNSGYSASAIYTDDSWLTNWYEFIDNTVNLSLPLSSSERWIPRWSHSTFKEFIERTFDAYDAAKYLAVKSWTEYYHGNFSSTNPTLENWKTMYSAYRERLLNYKKYTPYVSNLEKMRASANNNSNLSPVNNNNNAVTNPNTPIQDNPNTILLPKPIKPIDQTRPVTDPNNVTAPSNGSATIITLPPKVPEIETKPTDSVQSSYKISLPLSAPEKMRAVFDATITQQPNTQNTNTVLPTSPTTRSLRF